MNKIIKYLFIIITITLFLASSTGISFVIHHCSENHTDEFHLFTSDYACSHEKNSDEGYCDCCDNHNNTNDTKNYSIDKNHKCCSNTRGYYKVTDNFDFSRLHYNFAKFSVANEIFTFNKSNFSFDAITTIAINISPPPKLIGKNIVKFISQLLI